MGARKPPSLYLTNIKDEAGVWGGWRAKLKNNKENKYLIIHKYRYRCLLYGVQKEKVYVIDRTGKNISHDVM